MEKTLKTVPFQRLHICVFEAKHIWILIKTPFAKRPLWWNANRPLFLGKRCQSSLVFVGYKMSGSTGRPDILRGGLASDVCRGAPFAPQLRVCPTGGGTGGAHPSVYSCMRRLPDAPSLNYFLLGFLNAHAFVFYPASQCSMVGARRLRACPFVWYGRFKQVQRRLLYFTFLRV